VVRLLLNELGANMSLFYDGYTALCAAANFGREHVVRCLVQTFVADVNKAARDGNTPLIAAAGCKHSEVVVWLAKQGADSQASHPRGGTAADKS
jgi:ankyrin repeat protein